MDCPNMDSEFDDFDKYFEEYNQKFQLKINQQTVYLEHILVHIEKRMKISCDVCFEKYNSKTFCKNCNYLDFNNVVLEHKNHSNNDLSGVFIFYFNLKSYENVSGKLE